MLIKIVYVDKSVRFDVMETFSVPVTNGIHPAIVDICVEDNGTKIWSWHRPFTCIYRRLNSTKQKLVEAQTHEQQKNAIAQSS